MIRTSRRLAAAGLAVLLLAACGEGPARAGAAAVVGDDRIETSQLQDIVDRGLASPEAEQQFGADRANYTTQVLGRLVRARLLEAAARERGIEVTAGDVDAQLAEFAAQVGGREALEQQAAAGGIAKEDLPRFAREVALELRLGDELTEDVEVPEEQLASLYEQGRAQFEQVRARHILVADEAQARDILAQVQQDPGRFAELAAQFSTDESNKAEGGDLGMQGRGTFVPEFDDAAFTQPVGEPFVVQTQFGWHVVEVLERNTTTLAEATPQLRRAALEQERKDAVQQALVAVAEQVGVDISPRYGEWKADEARIVEARSSDDSSPEPTGGPEQPVQQPPAQEQPAEGQPTEPTS